MNLHPKLSPGERRAGDIDVNRPRRSNWTEDTDWQHDLGLCRRSAVGHLNRCGRRSLRVARLIPCGSRYDVSPIGEAGRIPRVRVRGTDEFGAMVCSVYLKLN